MRFLRFAVAVGVLSFTSCLDFDAARTACHDKGICFIDDTAEGTPITPRQGLGGCESTVAGEHAVIGNGFETWEQSCTGVHCVTGGIGP